MSKCNQQTLVWIVRYTNNPREGNREEICVYCEEVYQISANKETLREKRKEKKRKEKLSDSKTQTI